MSRQALSESHKLDTTRLAEKHEAQYRFVRVGDIPIRYLEQGREHLEAGPPLLLIHGYNGSIEHWYPYTLPGLAASRRILALDLPGCGYSGRSASYSLQNYAGTIAAFLQALGEHKVDIMGHSMGGQVAVGLAALYPELVHKLVLVGSSGLPWEGGFWRVPLLSLGDASVRHVRLYPMFLQVGMRARAPFQGLTLLQKETVRDELRALRSPTLLIWGENDRVVPLSYGRQMADLIPGAKLAVFPGCGHMPFYQKPVQFNRLVASFLSDAE